MGRILESFLVHGEDVRNVVKGGGGAEKCDLFSGGCTKEFFEISGNPISQGFQRWGDEGEPMGKSVSELGRDGGIVSVLRGW